MNTRGEPKMVLSKLKQIYGTNEHIENLENLFSIVLPLAKEKQIEIQLDPTLETKYNLYSGLTFQLITYIENTPIVIAKGGRYDDLVKKFNQEDRKSFGIGFSFSVDKLRELMTLNYKNKEKSTKVLIAYRTSKNINKALKKQQYWHNNGIVSVISHEPLKSQENEKKLLKANRCTKLEWID